MAYNSEKLSEPLSSFRLGLMFGLCMALIVFLFASLHSSKAQCQPIDNFSEIYYNNRKVATD